MTTANANSTLARDAKLAINAYNQAEGKSVTEYIDGYKLTGDVIDDPTTRFRCSSL